MMITKQNHPGTPLATTMPLASFQKMPPPLSREERFALAEQAQTMLEMSYVHLPQKRAMYAVDPVQRLRLLKYRIQQASQDQLQSEMQFHNEMLTIFAQVRDLHTNYLLPAPYSDKIAYLPFVIEEYYDDDHASHFIVTWTDPNYRYSAHFEDEVEVLYWNGTPIKRAVELNGDRQAGGNPDAHYQRGLSAMTIRPLVRMLPPDEETVRLRYRALNGKVYETEFVWQLYTQAQLDSAEQRAQATGESLAFGFDIQAVKTQEARKELLAPDAARAARRSELDRLKYQPTPDSIATTLPTMLQARTQATTSGQFGYIRVFTFMHPEADVFVAEFQRLLTLLPQDGLIIDVRGNGGGNILACERILQLLTTEKVEPARFQFINSPLTLALCQRYLDLQTWWPSISQSVETGTIQSLSFPITPPESLAILEPAYHGPVVLIVDALCYSATDIFSAGFQDHGIGKIIGTSGNTGAGGANVWTHSDLCALVGHLGPALHVSNLFSPLPQGAEMRVAIRRSLRVRQNAGIPVEDLGIVPHERHWLTKRDLLEHNVDLLESAGALLGSKA